MARPPRRSRRGLAALAGLALLLVALAALLQQIAPVGQEGPLLPTLSVHSSRSDGARALALWLAELGYRPTTIEHRPFAIDRQVRLLLVLAPRDNPSEAHVAQIVQWVERGGTLVLAADRPNRLLDRLGVQVRTRGALLAEAVPRQPVLRDPTVRRVEVDTRAALRLVRPEWVPLLGSSQSDSDLVAAVATIGRGRAYALAAQRPLSNAGLGRADNWMLALHLLAGVPAGSVVAFDEYHHGFTEHGTLGMRLLAEPWGWAILYAGGLLFAYVALRGRRFGGAVPPVPPGPRRSRVEYVVTLAALLRQGGHREWLCRQFAAQTKRALGSRYRVRADLGAADFASALAAHRPAAASLAGPLDRLERETPANDAAAIALLREVDTVRTRLLAS